MDKTLPGMKGYQIPGIKVIYDPCGKSTGDATVTISGR